mgnify:CR=1 FL=1
MRDALVESCAVRLRPIRLASLATIMGAVPLVVAGGPGIVWAQGAANVIVGTGAAILAWRYIARLRRDHAVSEPV